MSTKPDKRSWLLGRWETEDEDSSVVFYITQKRDSKKTVVYAFDKYDGENFRVTGIKWNGNSLSFETFVPSTKYCAQQTLHPISRNRIKLELTLIENWKRTWTPVLFPGEIPARKKISKRNKK